MEVHPGGQAAALGIRPGDPRATFGVEVGVLALAQAGAQLVEQGGAGDVPAGAGRRMVKVIPRG
jgi:hypothetical protein